MRLGIYGLKGDPVQTMHLALPEQAWTQHNLDSVEVVLAGQPVDKFEGVTDKEARFEMLEVGLADNDHFHASRVELDREGPSWMVETLLHYRNLHGPDVELFLIIGADRAPTIKNWHKADELVTLCTILVGPRDGLAVSEEWLKEVLPAGAKFGVIEMNASSTFIRKAVAAGWSIRYLVPDSIRAEIVARKLYLSPPAPVVAAPNSDSASPTATAQPVTPAAGTTDGAAETSGQPVNT